MAASLGTSLLTGTGGSGPSAATTTVPAHAPLASLLVGSPEKAACGRAEVETAVVLRRAPQLVHQLVQAVGARL